MQQTRHHCVALYLEDKYEELVLEAHFDVKCLDMPIGNRPSFQCTYYNKCSKDENTFSYHRMMMQCPKYKGKTLLKMYLTWTKAEAKEFTQLGKKFVKSLIGKSKRTHVDEAKNPSKKVPVSSKQGKTISMPPPKATPPKHTKVFDLNSEDDFSSR
jgi:hypothetical protein